MDYCFPCRRALNGTVTCPECGAYDSDMATPSDRSGGARAADPAVLDALVIEGPGTLESPDVSWSPTPSADVPTARRRCPPRLRKYGGRTLAAATFAMLGGLAATSLLPQHSAGAGPPQAAPSPEQASPDEPHVPVTESARASRSPERPATHPARGSVRDRNSGATRSPRATATHRESPASRTPAVPTSPPVPPVKARPTPRPSSGRPSHSASPTATPSASPTGSASSSPTSSPAPSTTGVPVTDVDVGEWTEPLLPDLRRSGAVGGPTTGR
jgi:hypothetical protein